METIGALAVLMLLLMIFCISPLFWFIVFGIFGHPVWFIVAFIWWALTD